MIFHDLTSLIRQVVETRYYHYNMATLSSFIIAARVYYNMKNYRDFLSSHNIPIPVFPQNP